MTAVQPIHDPATTIAGKPVPPPARARLQEARALLTRHGIVAGPVVGLDAEVVRARLRERIRTRWPEGTAACAFWLDDDEAACFDRSGRLRQPLTIYVDGPATAAAVTEASRRAGLAAMPGQSPDSVLLTAGHEGAAA
ncbi:MAG TPA: hypothetical protein VHO01_13845 [Jatrophihabitans sp.]|nr:hypothetical protein [Jatrophihabitans sp.]